ncbi:hypothetical protein PFLG_02773 [Plasmodium falciparum RAJ116]|uniref:Uncharacterized protein n=1 Tax=Plasmodium falciparum RAJ116 TaxID=580058 RepID=A0A0L0D2E3_PLAFA|nr:hypothetical protein PFLG_02773 [Plasmodium falciparum RAJ116]
MRGNIHVPYLRNILLYILIIQMMPDTKYENLLQYDLKIYRNDILEKEKKKNDLRNILFFPSLFWFNGQFCPPIPVVKYYSNLCAFKVKDYVTCSIHKF